MADKYLDGRFFTNGRSSQIDLDNKFNLTNYIKTTIKNSASTNMIEAGLIESQITDGGTESGTMTKTIQQYIDMGYTKVHVVGDFTGGTSGAVTIPLSNIATSGTFNVFCGPDIYMTILFDNTTTVTGSAFGDDLDLVTIKIS